MDRKKNQGGRPLRFKSVKELQRKIDAYFDTCDSHVKKVLNKKGELIEVPDPQPFTICGLALYLNISRVTLLNYEGRPKFLYTIKRAKLRIECQIETRALTGEYNPAAAIFNLKNNFGWKDKHEMESAGEVTYIIKTNMPGPKPLPDELKKIDDGEGD
jgi:hypothetical protein